MPLPIVHAARFFAYAIALSAVACVSSGPVLRERASVNIDVDCAIPTGPPLVKKFGVMNSGLVPLERYRRDLSKLPPLVAESLRIDLSMGKNTWLGDLVGGTINQIKYDWTGIDELTAALDTCDVLPYWSFCYTPQPLQGADGWRSVPRDLARWGEVAEAFARHFHDRKLQVGYFEVWNEPDFGEFFRGTRDDYFAMYDVAVRSFRRGDPDATVGGPSLAFSHGWVRPFIDFVEAHQLPLDFFSFHSIGGAAEGPSKESFALAGLETIRAALASNERFRTTDIHLNEYHPYYGPLAEKTASPALAARLFANFATFLEWTDVTVVSWAQLMDAGVVDRYGLIDADGKTRPAYRAFAIYGDMPIDRVSASVHVGDAAADARIGCMASADDARVVCVIWNDGTEAHDFAVNLKHISPKITGEWKVECIGPGNAKSITANNKSVAWHGCIGPGSLICLTSPVSSTSRPTTHLSPPSLAVTRLQRLYPLQRGGTEYAFFDRKDAVARLGTGSTPRGPAILAATLDRAPDVLDVRCDIPAVKGRSPTALLRVDFRNQQGRFVSAVEYRTASLMPTAIDLPWGTGQIPERVIVSDLSASSTLKMNLRECAPPDWDGRVILTAILDDSVTDARLTCTLGDAR